MKLKDIALKLNDMDNLWRNDPMDSDAVSITPDEKKELDNQLENELARRITLCDDLKEFEEFFEIWLTGQILTRSYAFERMLVLSNRRPDILMKYAWHLDAHSAPGEGWDIYSKALIKEAEEKSGGKIF